MVKNAAIFKLVTVARIEALKEDTTLVLDFCVLHIEEGSF
jgi:hypothetical protein